MRKLNLEIVEENMFDVIYNVGAKIIVLANRCPNDTKSALKVALK